MNSQRGFTLIETVIAITLMATLGLMAAHILSTSLRGTAESVQKVQHLAEAASVMEKIIANATKARTVGTPLTADSLRANLTDTEKAAVSIASSWKANASDSISVFLVTVTVNNAELAYAF